MGPSSRPTPLAVTSMHLVTHPSCRQHGLDWLTKLMLANTDVVLDTYMVPAAFSSPHSPHVSSAVVVDTSVDGALAFVWQFDMLVDAPMHVVMPHVRQHVVVPLSECADSPTALPIDPEVDMSFFLSLTMKMQLLAPRMSYMRTPSATGESAFNRLYREFDETADGRVVVVGQTMPLDDKFTPNALMTKSMTWIVADRVDGGARTRIRLVSTSSHTFSAAGDIVPIDDEARMRGCDVQACPDQVSKVERLATQYSATAPVGGYTELLASAATAALRQQERRRAFA
ncbi:Aste57867_24977 [Aphanomyces stellatus]|uniref:Aste57867_24977 protein n=1 Tax=Aphanomyces stellatus TaxID=120398 RepID=A0A485LU02_9STRA|nr:hypothetical protein As57867_024899 [Aphanomyces stellatus]VFU01608.1 Aste57867_24977 [Aphanomyces stellatus]